MSRDSCRCPWKELAVGKLVTAIIKVTGRDDRPSCPDIEPQGTRGKRRKEGVAAKTATLSFSFRLGAEAGVRA
jgi:hypothetical protein